MSGQQNQPRRGNWNRAPSSPVYYQAPLPWVASRSPPPIISGPRAQSITANTSNHTNNGVYRASQSPGPVGRSTTPLSPMFGQSSGMRGSRGPQNVYPQPRWPGSPPPIAHIQNQSRMTSSPVQFGPKPYRAPSCFSPVHTYVTPTPVYGTPPEYLYSAPPPQFEFESPRYEYVGVPLEPPPSQSYVIYDDDGEDHGPSTAEIIANQSQDYVDEKLAEYQLTIAQLQGKLFGLVFEIFSQIIKLPHATRHQRSFTH